MKIIQDIRYAQRVYRYRMKITDLLTNLSPMPG